MKFRNQAKRYGAVLVGSLVSAGAFATPAGTYDDLTNAVDWSDVGTALIAVAAAIVGVLVIRKGIKLVLGMVR